MGSCDSMLLHGVYRSTKTKRELFVVVYCMLHALYGILLSSQKVSTWKYTLHPVDCNYHQEHNSC